MERTYLSKIEKGVYLPQLDTIILIAQGLRVSVSELFEGFVIPDIDRHR